MSDNTNNIESNNNPHKKVVRRENAQQQPKENPVGNKDKDKDNEETVPVSASQLPPVIVDHRILAAKLNETNWMEDVPDNNCPSEIVEVRFKNTRKGFFLNSSNLNLKVGDIVAVEATLGHDIGIVVLTGPLVQEQMRLKRIDTDRNPLKKVYRRAKPNDIEKWQQAIALEQSTMIRSRQIASDLHLNMKIGDVEYQGDKTKAIFYYIADDRVDFRALIKVLAETFRIRIEMKQIGTRQEAGRIGSIGPCGRQLCCSTFITNFVSVSTSAARYQDISLNPQKLAGQCGKLKCCLNYEVDAYIDVQKDFPPNNIPLNTGDGLLYYQKSDIFGRAMLFTFDKEGRGALIRIPIERIKEILAMNKRGIIPPKPLNEDGKEPTPEEIGYTDGVGEESLNRFDDKHSKRRRNKNRNRNNENAQNTVSAEQTSDNESNEDRNDNRNNNRPKELNRNNNRNDNYNNNRNSDKRGDNRNEGKTDNRDNRNNENRGEGNRRDGHYDNRDNRNRNNNNKNNNRRPFNNNSREQDKPQNDAQNKSQNDVQKPQNDAASQSENNTTNE